MQAREVEMRQIDEYHKGMADKQPAPHKTLGSKIKFLRQQWNQSLGEVSDTLEIEEKTLKSIEEGRTLPHDDLLEMLISHFLLTDEQARELKQLAQSEKHLGADLPLIPGLDDTLMKQIVMLLPQDNKVVYTDGMRATVNDSGVVMQFTQQQKPNGPQVTISRIGMSRDHAERVIKVLQDTLSEYDKNQHQKILPKPKQQ